MPPSDYLATYRLSGFNPRLYLSVYQPAVAASGTLSSTPSNNTTSIAVSFVVGSETDVKAGFQIVFTDTATGIYKGEGRIRFAGSITSSSLPIRELAQGTASLASGDTFTVYRFVPLESKLTASDASFAPDGIPYSDQGSNPPPIPGSGGHWPGRVDSGQTFATVTTDGTNSSLVDPDSSTPVTHLWTLPAGVAFQAGSASTDASPVLEVNAGSYLVQHDVTDPDNGKTATQYVAYRVHDANDTPYEVLLTALDGDTESGVSFTVEGMGQAGVASDAFALTDIPYGALALLWSDDWFTDGVTRDLHRSAVTGRSHLLGMGCISYETNAGDAETGDTVSFEIRSPLTRLSEIAAYSKVMLAEASPDDWNELKTLGVKRGLTQLVQFYTTLTEAGYDYVYHADFSDALYPAHFLQRSDPMAQLRELVDARNAWLVQRERGARFEVMPLPYCRVLNDRADLDITLTDEDVFDYDYSVSHFDRIESFELRGITAGASGNTDVYSRSPGSSPGYGKDADTIERVIPDDQANANIICGMRYAFAEQIYIDADGLKQRVGELTLRCPGLYNVLDFTGRFVKFNYANPRWDFNDLRFWLKRYAFEVDAESGEPLTTFVWQAETAAPAGTTYTPPVENVTVAPTSPVQPVVKPIQTIIPISGNAPSELLEFTAGVAECILRRDFVAGVGYSTVVDKSTGLSSAVSNYYSDPYAYDSGFAFNAQGANYGAAIGTAGFAGWVNRRTLAQLYGAGATATLCAKGDHKKNGWGIAASDDGHYAITNDNWVSNTTYVTPNTYSFISIAVLGHDAGVVLALAEELFDDGFGINRRLRLYKSPDYGVTFASVYVTGTFGYAGTGYTGSVEVPYQRPSAQGGGNNTIASGLIVRLSYTYWFGGSGNGGIFQSVDGGVTFPETIETASGSIGSGSVNDFWTYRPNYALSTHTHDADRMIWPGLRYTGGYYARVTNDANVTNYANVQLVGNSSVAFNGWPAIGTSDPGVGWWVGFDSGGGLWVSSDNGQTWLLITSDAKNYAEFRLAPEQ